ncbi:MAG: DNA replication/repair protein RecF [Myxococcales bacterium]|nr:DNA replication/repair protein RecF [Myxococcales bacterium]
MHLERVWADGFRNLVSVELLPHPRFNIIEGNNGQGKTNLLEAIYLLGGLRSFRTTRLSECIEFDGDRSEIAGTISRKGVSTDLGVELGGKRAARSRGDRAKGDRAKGDRAKGGRSKVWVNGKVAARAADYLGRLVVVLFTPEHLRLPFGEPDARRRYLDRALFNHQPGWLATLRKYERTLSQRNALLRQVGARQATADMVPVYDELLADAGAELSFGRATFAESFSARVAEEFSSVAAPGLTANLRYKARGAIEPGMDQDARKAALLAALTDKNELDIRRGFTSVGPHLDDLVLEIGGRPAKVHASAGQCRALVLAMKIAEIRSLEQHLGEPPVLLMDDVSSELDAQRNSALMAHLDALGGQVFLTTTDADFIRLTAPRQVVQVEAGRLVSGGGTTESAVPEDAVIGDVAPEISQSVPEAG